MQAYTGFAEVYDRFMTNVPYDKWQERLTARLAQEGIRDGLVLELGCGTGIMTERMAEAGYDMIGLDLSDDMLAEAMEKRQESGHSILYLQQDMREFELYGTVAAIYCICDSLNYILEDRDLIRVFSLVNNYLDPGGIFLFDFNTEAAYLRPERRHPIIEETEGITLIWENSYDPRTAVNEHRVTFFLPVTEEPLYMKIHEIHEQRALSPETVCAALRESGLLLCEMIDAETGGAVTRRTRRVFAVAREQGKKKERIQEGNTNV